MTPTTGLVLTGGGARAAYQVGVLKAVMQIRRESNAPPGNPFPVITGTSAGAINAAALACRCANIDDAVRVLAEVWENFHAEQIYRADSLGVIRTGARWLTLFSLGWLIARWRRARPRSLLDNAPAADLLQRVRIPSPATRLDDYPHQFSGGMRQRVCSAMAIACTPRLLIADEPTSNLDVTIQVQMMELFRDIQRETGVGIILITHDLGVAAGICHRIAVMYAGRVVETGDVRTVYRRPAHPYTRALLDSIPHLGQRRRRLYSIGGQPPSLIDPPIGCRFAARCPKVQEQCRAEYPPEVELSRGHRTACWFPLEAA